MDHDRRDGRPRAEAVRQIVERLMSSSARPVTCRELACSTGIPESATLRIVRSLALRMLVRNVAPGRWIPTVVLYGDALMFQCV